MKARIKLAFRAKIDQSSTMQWEKYVFEDTHFEYKIQHQVFDEKSNPVQNYWELLAKNKNAERIPFLLSAVAQNYVKQLGGKIHTLTDVLGNQYFEFEYFKLDLVSSNTQDKSKHKLGLTFYSPELLLIDIIDQKYLLSKDLEQKDTYPTFMFPFHPQVAIAQYSPL